MAGLIAETGATLREAQFGWLGEVAVLPEARRADLLRSVERFRDAELNPLGEEIREELLARPARCASRGLAFCLARCTMPTPTMSPPARSSMPPAFGRSSARATCPANPISRCVLYYFSIHLRIHPKPAFVLDISSHIETENLALARYHSQLIQVLNDAAHGPRRHPRSCALWGWTIGTAYGEPFASREEIGLRGLGDLA